MEGTENKDTDLLAQISVLNAQVEEHEKTIEAYKVTLEAKDAEIENLKAELAKKAPVPPVKKEKTQLEKLKEYAGSKSKGDVLFINDNYEWMTHETKGYTAATREEILKLK